MNRDYMKEIEIEINEIEGFDLVLTQPGSESLKSVPSLL